MWKKDSNAFYLYNTVRLTKTILLCLIFAYLFNAQKGINHCILFKNFSYLCRKIAIKQLFTIFESQTKKIAIVCILNIVYLYYVVLGNGWSFTASAYNNFDPGCFNLKFAQFVDRSQFYTAGLTKRWNDGSALTFMYKYNDVHNLTSLAKYARMLQALTELYLQANTSCLSR